MSCPTIPASPVVKSEPSKFKIGDDEVVAIGQLKAEPGWKSAGRSKIIVNRVFRPVDQSANGIIRQSEVSDLAGTLPGSKL